MLEKTDNYCGKKKNLFAYFVTNTSLWIKCKNKTTVFRPELDLAGQPALSHVLEQKLI